MFDSEKPETGVPIRYIEKKIRDVADAEFQVMIRELCLCVGFDFDEMSENSLRFLLMAIGRENRKLARRHAPLTTALGMKVSKLLRGSPVWRICKELGDLTGTNIEAFDAQTVLAVLKKYQPFFCPKLTIKKPNRARRSYDFTTSLIRRRRQNGSL